MFEIDPCRIRVVIIEEFDRRLSMCLLPFHNIDYCTAIIGWVRFEIIHYYLFTPAERAIAEESALETSQEEEEKGVRKIAYGNTIFHVSLFIHY
jgi:hypothetical protein